MTRVPHATISKRGDSQFQKHGLSRAEVLYDTDPMDLRPAALVPPPVAIPHSVAPAAALADARGSVFPKYRGTCYPCSQFRAPPRTSHTAWRQSAVPNQPAYTPICQPMTAALLETSLPFPLRRGKVRDVYDLGDRLLLISTDRISAFDWVLPSGIPDRGRLLTQLANFWFEHLKLGNQIIETDVERMGLPAEVDLQPLRGRTTLVRKTQVIPVECVVRGYLAGSGWKDYQQTGAVCGIPLPAGLRQADQLPEPIFTPATKAETGHDENISFEQVVELVGQERAEELRRSSIDIYQTGADYARDRGIIIADTKFEFGLLDDGQLILIDEVLTSDSSRFWPADQYAPGGSPPSFDKQFVRDWLESTTWDKQSPPPALPEDVIAKTRAKYVEAYERLTGKRFEEPA